MAEEKKPEIPAVTDPTSFTIACSCTDDCGNLYELKDGSLEAWKAIVEAGRVGKFVCQECGCVYDPVVQGDAIVQTRVVQAH